MLATGSRHLHPFDRLPLVCVAAWHSQAWCCFPASTLQVILLSDGSVTRHLQLMTNQRVEVGASPQRGARPPFSTQQPVRRGCWPLKGSISVAQHLRARNRPLKAPLNLATLFQPQLPVAQPALAPLRAPLPRSSVWSSATLGTSEPDCLRRPRSLRGPWCSGR